MLPVRRFAVERASILPLFASRTKNEVCLAQIRVEGVFKRIPNALQEQYQVGIHWREPIILLYLVNA